MPLCPVFRDLARPDVTLQYTLLYAPLFFLHYLPDSAGAKVKLLSMRTFVVARPSPDTHIHTTTGTNFDSGWYWSKQLWPCRVTARCSLVWDELHWPMVLLVLLSSLYRPLTARAHSILAGTYVAHWHKVFALGLFCEPRWVHSFIQRVGRAAREPCREPRADRCSTCSSNAFKEFQARSHSSFVPARRARWVCRASLTIDSGR